MVKVPTFTMTLPVSQQQVEYRPFVVKEEKILILANESEDTGSVVRAIGDVVKECTFGKVILDDVSIADIQYAFLQIRGKSIGEEFNFYAICGECKHKHITTFNVNEFEMKNEAVDNKISLGGGVTVELKYPGLQHYAMLFETEDVDKIYEVVVDCITKIYTDEEVFVNNKEARNEVLEFINNLTPAQFEEIENFFLNMPILYKKVDFMCQGCNKLNNLVIDSITSFFE